MKITQSARNRKIYMCTFYTEERGHTHTHTHTDDQDRMMAEVLPENVPRPVSVVAVDVTPDIRNDANRTQVPFQFFF